MSLAYCRAIRHRRDGVVSAGIGHNRVQDLAEPPRYRQRRLGPDTGLRWTARALEKHHHPARHAPGHVRTVVAFHEREAEVDAGADPSTGDERSVLDEQRIWVHRDAGIGACQLLAMRPMRGGAA